jgi:hypothetical protein
MARGSDNSTTIALGILILVAIVYLFKSSDTTVSNLEDRINTRFPSLDVQSSVDRLLGYRTGGGLQGLLLKAQQRFGTDIFPSRPPGGAQIETGIDPLAAIMAAGGATATYDTSSVLSADEGGSGGMS